MNELKSEGSKKNIYCEIFNSPFLTCGKNSFINDIIFYAGGKNIFDSLESSYPQVSEEVIIMMNPEIILAPDYSEFDIEKIDYVIIHELGYKYFRIQSILYEHRWNCL